MAEAFSITCHELANFDFRCGSLPEVSLGPMFGLLCDSKQTPSTKAPVPYIGSTEFQIPPATA